MASAELLRLWAEVEVELRGAIDRLLVLNPTAKVGFAEDYLKHNELGLSCESIEYAIENQSLTADSAIETHLKKARGLMEMSNSGDSV